MNPRIRAVFFDLDDTLCDYMESAAAAREWVFHLIARDHRDLTAAGLLEAWREEFERMLPEVRAGGPLRDAYLVSGRTTRTELMRRALLRFGVEDLALAERMSDAYNQDRIRRLKLFDDAEPVLSALAERWPLGVITNGPADTQREELSALGLTRRMSAVFIEGEFGLGKPHPSIFRAAADSVSAKPEEVLFVGNSLEHDIRGARKAGMRTCWVAAKGGAKSEADAVVSNLTEAKAWIEAQAATSMPHEPRS